jgi:hypothetical protein
MFENTNHENGFIRALIRNAKPIAELINLSRECSMTSIELKSYCGHINIEWFYAHHEHKLVVRDEYKHLENQCIIRVTCGTCNIIHDCILELDHSGPHQFKITT